MLIGTLALAALVLTASPAQSQHAAPAPGQKPPAAQTPKAPEKPSTVAVPEVRPPEGQPVNIRIELTITDQRGDTTPITKTVTMMASDRSYSRIRTSGDVRTPTGFRPVILNIDARPTLTRDNKVRLDLTIEYRPVAAEAESEKSTTPSINESLSVILEDGKQMLISQSADPVTDRKVKVEAKASIPR